MYNERNSCSLEATMYSYFIVLEEKSGDMCFWNFTLWSSSQCYLLGSNPNSLDLNPIQNTGRNSIRSFFLTTFSWYHDFTGSGVYFGNKLQPSNYIYTDTSLLIQLAQYDMKIHFFYNMPCRLRQNVPDWIVIQNSGLRFCPELQHTFYMEMFWIFNS